MDGSAPGLLAPLSVFDAHVDSLQLALDLGRDLSRAGQGHLDLERGRAGGLGQVVCVAWPDPSYLQRGPGATRARATALLDELDALCARHPTLVGLARSGAEVEELAAEGRVAAIAGIEGGHALEDPQPDLEHFFERGLRVLTLCWNNHLPWIRSCQPDAGPGVPAGLSDLGRELVLRLNQLGVLVDVSHAGERSFFDVLEASRAPVVASHSGCRALSDHPRNLTDEQLAALGDAGGVVGIVFCTPFLDLGARDAEHALRRTPGYRALQGANDTETHLLQGEYLQERLPPFPLERVVAHVEHALEVAGIDHVGIGSDFDGIQRRPQGLEDATGYPRLAARLAERGFGRDDLAKIFGGNLRRVFAAATRPGTVAAERGTG